MNDMEKIEKDTISIENEDICFCCGESHDIFHMGQINCSDCTKSFKTQMGYERHIFITHSESNEFSCSICNAKLRTSDLMRLHEEEHKNCGRFYGYKMSGKDFDCKFELKFHQKSTSCLLNDKSLIKDDTTDIKFKENEVLEITTEQSLLNNELCTSIENENIKIEPKNSISESLLDVNKNNKMSVEDDTSLQQLNDNEVPTATTEQLLLNNELYTIITLENKNIQMVQKTIVPGGIIGATNEDRKPL
ncbi:protein suppressor of hairy wing-like, partial [Teleopsis dalmanni]